MGRLQNKNTYLKIFYFLEPNILLALALWIIYLTKMFYSKVKSTESKER